MQLQWLNDAKTQLKVLSSFHRCGWCGRRKEELVEVVDFLKNPRKYKALGARILRVFS